MHGARVAPRPRPPADAAALLSATYVMLCDLQAVHPTAERVAQLRLLAAMLRTLDP